MLAFPCPITLKWLLNYGYYDIMYNQKIHRHTDIHDKCSRNTVSVEYRLQLHDRKYDGRRPVQWPQDDSGLYTAVIQECAPGRRRRSIAGHFTASLRRRLRTSARVRPGAFLLDATTDDDTSATATNVHLVIGRAPLPRDTPPSPRRGVFHTRNINRSPDRISTQMRPSRAYLSFPHL